MTKNYSVVLAVVMVIASNVLMFNLGKSTSIQITSSTTTSTGTKTAPSYRVDPSGKNGNQTTATDRGSSARPSLTKFDVIRQTLYNTASNVVKTKRQKFILDEEWVRGTGGLDDNDRLVLGELYYNATSVFEYGLGESTRIAAFVGVPRYSGVDSDPEWVAKARKEAKHSHFRFYYGDIGDTKMFGHPVDSSLQKIQYNYQIAPLVSEDKPFDVYLVDGRYRVACASISFLHAMKTGGDMEKVRVGIHDNDGILRGYGVFAQVADVVIKNKKLWVYKLKTGITENDLYNMWEAKHNDETR
jgi:hypothetical protein